MVARERELAGLPASSDRPRGLLQALLDRLAGPFRRGAPPAARPATGFYTDTSVCIGCKACEVACKQWNQLPADGFDWTGNSYDNTGELSATSWRHVKFVEQFPLISTPLPQRERRDKEAALPAGEMGRGEGSEPSAKKFTLELAPEEPTPGRWLMMSDVCKHCVTAPCQQACPTGALLHNEFDNVYVQQDICNGCTYCVAACPFGVIARGTFDGHAHKCTLCYDRQRDGLVPACAKACPTQSIQFGPVDELQKRARQRVEELHRRGVPAAYLYGDEPTATYSGLHSFYLLIDRPSTYGLPDAPFNPWLRMKGDYVRAVVGGLAAVAVLLAAVILLGH
jgi:formate dehydrogenase iron-sulfur subunit